MNKNIISRNIIEFKSLYLDMSTSKNTQLTKNINKLNTSFKLLEDCYNFVSLYTIDQYKSIKSETYITTDKIWKFHSSNASTDEERTNVDDTFSQMYNCLNSLFAEFDHEYQIDYYLE